MSLSLLEFAMSGSAPPTPPALQTDAYTPEQFMSVFQPLIANILGLTANPSPWSWMSTPAAWNGVRISWQTQGQPAWEITEDVCILSAYPQDDEYSRIRDQQYVQQDGETLVARQSYTQVWDLHYVFYGPNAYARAAQVVSAMAQSWVHDALAGDSIYLIVEYARPHYAPELFQGQWWERADLHLKYNELVTETTPTSSAAGVDVTIDTDTGQSESFEIKIP